LEGQVKVAHAFTKEEVLLYYDMTLVDHAVLSHLFESESTLNLVEVITSIKSVIVTNALTHDFLQDALNRSISLFTFLQRGGLAKEKCHDYYISLVDQVLASQKATVTNEAMNGAVEYLCKKLVELSMSAITTTPPTSPTEGQSQVPVTSDNTSLVSDVGSTSQPVPTAVAAPATPTPAIPVDATPTPAVIPPAESIPPAPQVPVPEIPAFEQPAPVPSAPQA
jgi:hypothetical protein